MNIQDLLADQRAQEARELAHQHFGEQTRTAFFEARLVIRVTLAAVVALGLFAVPVARGDRAATLTLAAGIVVLCLLASSVWLTARREARAAVLAFERARGGA